MQKNNSQCPKTAKNPNIPGQTSYLLRCGLTTCGISKIRLFLRSVNLTRCNLLPGATAWWTSTPHDLCVVAVAVRTPNLALFLLLLTAVLIPATHCRNEFTKDGWFYRSYSGLMEVPSDIPKSAVGVYINNNFITSLRPFGFSHLTLCSFLNVASNNIDDVEVNAFQGLDSINEIWMGGNSLIELKPGMFAGLESLESLVLSSNKINSTHPEAFKSLEKLKKLYLYENELTTLPKGMFAYLKSLELLVLTYNHIRIVEPGAFNGLSNLRDLWMDNNGFQVSRVLSSCTTSQIVDGIDSLLCVPRTCGATCFWGCTDLRCSTSTSTASRDVSSALCSPDSPTCAKSAWTTTKSRKSLQVGIGWTGPEVARM